jgi:hypothetical protein
MGAWNLKRPEPSLYTSSPLPTVQFFHSGNLPFVPPRDKKEYHVVSTYVPKFTITDLSDRGFSRFSHLGNDHQDATEPKKTLQASSF